MFQIIEKIISKIAFTFIILGVLAAIVWHTFVGELEKVHFLHEYAPPISSCLYDQDFKKLRELSWEKRYFIRLEKIPKKLILAFLSAEDKHFFHHFGLDILGLTRAFLENTFKRNWKNPLGASTITQQVAKNMVVGNQHSFERKISEALTALAMEYSFTKEHILELYLNEIYLGKKAYGVVAAAQAYFNKAIDDLSLSECAFLATLPKAPSNYSKEKALERRNWVIGRLYEDGHITKEEAILARNDPLTIDQRTDQKDLDYFSEQIRRNLLSLFGEQQLYSEGLRVFTTQKKHYQDAAEQALQTGLLNIDKELGYRGPIVQCELPPHIDDDRWHGSDICRSLKKIPCVIKQWQVAMVLDINPKTKDLKLGTAKGHIIKMPPKGYAWTKTIPNIGDIILIEQKDKSITLQQLPEITGGIIVMDPKTGAVLAMSGGFDARLSHFNTVTQAKRQPGSCFKPFVYMAALEKGYTGNSIIDDAPIEIYLGPNLGYYTPQNITKKSYGPTPMRVGIEQSRNQMTIQIALKIGMKSVSDVALRFCVCEQEYNELAVCLGAAETTLLNLATAYGMIANGGKKIIPHFIDLIQDNTGKIIYAQDCNFYQVIQDQPRMFDNREVIIQESVCSDMSDFLKGVVTRGTARRLLPTLEKKNIEFCAKTGTTNDYKDAWCVGYTKNLKHKNFVIGVFVGYPIPKSMGEGATGSRIALPIIDLFLRHIL
ncbi:MAG: Penicillin-binding protein 1A [Holosporales bacterium]